MSFYGYRSPEMLREIAKWADGRATVYTPKLQTYSSNLCSHKSADDLIYMVRIRQR